MSRLTRSTHLCTSVGRWRGLYTVNATFGGENVSPVWRNTVFQLVLDTGAADVGLSGSVFDRLRLPVLSTEQRSGAGGSYTARISTVEIRVDGRIRIPNVRVSTMANIDTNVAGLLGLSFLEKIQLYTDFNRMVTVEENELPLIRFYYPPEYAIEG